jgi:hypothetical protein
MDRANVLLLRRTLNVLAAHAGGNKNMRKIFCSGKRRKRDWGDKIVGFETLVNLYLTHFFYLSSLAKFIIYFS